MGFRPSFKGQPRAEYRATTDLGWAIVVSFAIVVLIVA
jgi:hypothetical protein